MLEFFLIGVALAVLVLILSIGGALLTNWLFPKPLDLGSILDDKKENGV
ncbi:hypothetical protein [Caballeronia sp. LZ035]|nr:hypothetical protein [Caballeronia sp. LZ035]MDR5758194.1 hypothetical protein [Caballeronia sp. LZ035]